MDNSSKMFLLDNTVLVRDAIVMVIEKLGISDGDPLAVAPYFALYECLDGKTIGKAVQPEAILVDKVQTAKDPNYKLVFMIRLYMPSIYGIEYRDLVAKRLEKPMSMLSDELYIEAAEVTDEEMLRIQFIQAIYFVITGQYYTTEQQILKLASFLFFFKFGAFKQNVHKKGFLNERIVEFIPLRHLKEKGLDDWEHKLFEYIQGTGQYENQFEYQSEAQRKFMDEVYGMETYGCTSFKVSVTGLIDPANPIISSNDEKESRKVLLNISYKGISIYDKSVQRGLICGFSYGEMLSWGYNNNSGSAYVKLPKLDPSDPSDQKPYDHVGSKGILEFLSIDSKDEESGQNHGNGKIISDLLTDYCLAFGRESSFEVARGGDIYGATDVGEDIIPGSSVDFVEKAITSAPKGATFTPRAQLEKAKAEAMQNSTMSPPNAAVQIQKLFRGYSLRQAWVKEACAELIQAQWRGFAARKKVEKMIDAMDLDDSAST